MNRSRHVFTFVMEKIGFGLGASFRKVLQLLLLAFSSREMDRIGTLGTVALVGVGLIVRTLMREVCISVFFFVLFGFSFLLSFLFLFYFFIF